MRTIALAVTLACSVMASHAQDAQGQSTTPAIARPAPLVTAPAVGTNALAVGATAHSGSLVTTGQEQAASAPVSLGATDVSVPFVLGPDQHPWPLTFTPLQVRQSLFLNLPSISEARMFSPGAALDAARSLQRDVNKYISDLIGVSIQQRGAQYQKLNTWVAQIEQQRRTLSGDAWQDYQFALEARPQAEEFLRQAQAQVNVDNDLVAEVSAMMQNINARVAVMPTVEAQDEWYGLIVALRDGVMLYQRQVAKADQQLISLAEGFLRQAKPPVRPAGAVPVKTPQGGAAVTLAPEVKSLEQAAPKREPAPVAPVAMQERPPYLSYAVFAFLVLGTFGYILYRRKRAGVVSVPTQSA